MFLPFAKSASSWRGVLTSERGGIDVNVPTQMFEEFYEAYDVKEGDGMYLAPEDRIALW